MRINALLWALLQLIVGYNLILPILFFVLYIFKRKPKSGVFNPFEADYAIIVTAYEQTQLLPTVIQSLLRLNYQNYLIYIVADNCDITGLRFDSEKVILLRPEHTLASNTRSHFYAISHFKRPHERLTIVDSDNLVDSNYLTELNIFFDRGFVAVQGVRDAKNLNTTYACLDAARDIYYHFYDGKVLFNLGSSATLAGSGMAFTTDLYQECLGHLDITGAGFDKVLQYEIVKRKHRIAFAEKAVVFDEKTTKSDQLVKQRARWINTWFRYFIFGFKLVAKGILNVNLNQLLLGIVLLRPPLFIFLLLSLFFLLINLFLSPLVALIWFAGLLLFVAGFYLALIKSRTDKRIYKSLKGIPAFIFYQIISLLNARSANKKSVSTVHYHNSEIKG